MGEPRAIVIALVVDEYLRFIFEPPKCRRVQNAVTVPLKCGSIDIVFLGKLTSPRVSTLDGIRRERLLFLCFTLLAGNNHCNCSYRLDAAWRRHNDLRAIV